MTERVHFHFSLSCIGEENGSPVQYSCLENPRDGGAWWAAIYGVAQSRIANSTIFIPGNHTLEIESYFPHFPQFPPLIQSANVNDSLHVISCISLPSYVPRDTLIQALKLELSLLLLNSSSHLSLSPFKSIRHFILIVQDSGTLGIKLAVCIQLYGTRSILFCESCYST